MSALLDSLVRMVQEASDVIDQGEKKGMAVTDQLFALKDIHTSLVESRTLVHTFTLDRIKPELDKGIQLAAATYRQGLDLLGEYNFRRTGLGISTIFITLLAVLIWLTIRRLER